MAHRYGAAFVALAVVGAAVAVFRRAPSGSPLRKLAVGACLAVLLQGTLGVLSVTTLLHRPIVVAHLGGAALLLGFVVWTWSLLPATSAVARPLSGSAAPPLDGPAGDARPRVDAGEEAAEVGA
jgi:heme A synthase